MENRSFLSPIVMDISTEQLQKLADLFGVIVTPYVVPLYKLSDFKDNVVKITDTETGKFKWSVNI